MINLIVQVRAIIFSFLYGIFLAFMFNINYKLLFHHKKMVRLFFDFIFVIDCGILYFYILEILAYGYLHIYFLLFLSLGFLLFYSLFKKLLRKNTVNK